MTYNIVSIYVCFSNQTGEQDVQMTNDKKVVSHYNDPKKAQSGKPVDQSKLNIL